MANNATQHSTRYLVAFPHTILIPNFNISTVPRFPKELHLCRKELGQVIATRTGLGDFADYQIRFKNEEPNLNCHCGSPKTPTHFMFCRILRRRGGRPSGPINQIPESNWHTGRSKNFNHIAQPNSILRGNLPSIRDTFNSFFCFIFYFFPF